MIPRLNTVEWSIRPRSAVDSAQGNWGISSPIPPRSLEVIKSSVEECFWMSKLIIQCYKVMNSQIIIIIIIIIIITIIGC